MGIISAIIGWLQYHLGLRTDTASSTGSLQAKINYLVCPGAIASNTLQASSDTEVFASNGSTYGKVKEIIMHVNGTVRVKFDIRSGQGTFGADGCIYINGVKAGAIHSNQSTYVTYSEDFIVSENDRIQLYVADSGEGTYARNFRMYFDLNKLSPAVVIS